MCCTVHVCILVHYVWCTYISTYITYIWFMSLLHCSTDINKEKDQKEIVHIAFIQSPVCHWHSSLGNPCTLEQREYHIWSSLPCFVVCTCVLLLRVCAGTAVQGFILLLVSSALMTSFYHSGCTETAAKGYYENMWKCSDNQLPVWVCHVVVGRCVCQSSVVVTSQNQFPY